MLALKKSATFISSWAIYALFALLPVFFLPLSWVTLPESKVLLAVALLIVAVIAGAVSVFVSGGMRLPRTLVLPAAVLLALAYAISTIVSGGSSFSVWGTGVEQDTLAAVILLAVALLAVAVLFSEHLIRSIHAVRALFIGSIALYLLEFAHLLFPSQTSLGGIWSSQTANPFGGWYELSIISGVLLFLSLACVPSPVAKGFWKYAAWATAALSFLMLVIINAPEVWLVLAVMSLLAIALDVLVPTPLHRLSEQGSDARSASGARVWGFARRQWRAMLHIRAWKPHLVWIGMFLVAMTFFFFGSVVNRYLPAQIKISVTEVRPSWAGTLSVGSHALSHKEKLVFGSGPNTFTRNWTLYKPLEVNQTVFWNTDFTSGVGLIPTSFITVGIIGALAWLFFIVSILWLTIRLAYANQEQGAATVLRPLLLGVLFLVAFHILYVPGPALSILTFLLLGLATAYAASLGRIRYVFLSTSGGRFAPQAYLAGLIVFVALAVVVLLGIARVVSAEILVNRSVVSYNATGDLARSTALVSQALRIYPQDARAARAAVELGLLQIQKLAAANATEETRAQLKTAIENTIRYGLGAVSVAGDDYQNWIELATLYHQLAGGGVDGAYENAEEAYEKLIAQNPTSPLPHFKKAQLALLRNDPDAALQDLLTAVKLKPDFAIAYYLASQIYASQNDFQNALIPAASAARYASNDPLAWYNLGAIAYTAGNYKDAGVALERAVSLEPRYANALYALGLSYYQLGRTDDAMKTFQKLDTVDPDEPLVEEALANLKAGKAPFAQTATSTSVAKPSSAKKK